MKHHIYVATHGNSGMITHLIMDGNGCISETEKYPADCPDYMTLDGDTLYVLLREPYRAQGGVQRYSVKANGALQSEGIPLPTRGSIPAYILRHNGFTYVTNYIQGTTIRLPNLLTVHLGHSVHPVRQLCSHPHCIVSVPNSNYLCIADLGTDKVYVTDGDLSVLSETDFPAGSGPRHIVFSQDGKLAYCVSEMSSQLFVLERKGYRLNHVHTYSTLPNNCGAESTASAVRISPDGRYALASNRGHDSICVYAIHGTELTDPKWVSSGGASPRDMTFVGEFLACGNELSDNIVLFKLENGQLKAVGEPIQIICPWCICSWEEKNRL